MFYTPKVPPPEKRQKKETLLSAELGKFMDKKIRVKFQGGREGQDSAFYNSGYVHQGSDLKLLTQEWCCAPTLDISTSNA